MRELVWRVARWIEGAIGERRLFLPLTIAWAVLTFLATIGLISGGLGLGITIFAMVSLYLMVIVLVLLVSRRYLTSDLHAYTLALNRYSDKARVRQQQNPALFSIESWREEIGVSKNAHARIRRWFTLRVGQQESIDTFWTLASRNSNQYLSKRQQDRVRVTAYHFDAAGVTQARYRVTRQWEETKFLRIFVHLNEDHAPGTSIQVLVDIEWPKYFADLQNGELEEFYWTFRRATLAMSSRVEFERGFTSGQFVATPMIGSSAPSIIKEVSGATSVSFAASSITIDAKHGYTLDVAR